jgi:hypothetical protein
VTAYHERLDEARVLCSTVNLPPPATPADPSVPLAADRILKTLGYHPDNARPWWDD